MRSPFPKRNRALDSPRVWTALNAASAPTKLRWKRTISRRKIWSKRKWTMSLVARRSLPMLTVSAVSSFCYLLSEVTCPLRYTELTYSLFFPLQLNAPPKAAMGNVRTSSSCRFAVQMNRWLHSWRYVSLLTSNVRYPCLTAPVYFVRCSVERKLELDDKAGNESLALLFAFVFGIFLQRGANGAFTKCFGGAYVTQNYQVDTTIPKFKIDRRHRPAHRLFYDLRKLFGGHRSSFFMQFYFLSFFLLWLWILRFLTINTIGLVQM